MEVGVGLGLIVAAVTIAAALGSAIAVFRASAYRSSYNAMTKTVKALEGRIVHVEAENRELRGEMKRMTKDFAHEVARDVIPALVEGMAPALIAELERRGAFNGQR